ncbi:MAG: hypothetical protein PX635_02785 [Nostocales cyanobacterium LE14-WE12]|jgi:hypothetical protein|nr:hypothetical protein [Nostocales cyanobacterium LE14-WE12]
MYQKLSTDEAIKLLKYDHSAGWSWEGATALIEYLENLEDSDKPIKFDRVALRCDFSEYDSVLEAAEHYDFIPPDDEDEDEIEAEALKYLEDRTTVIQFEGGVIIKDF